MPRRFLRRYLPPPHRLKEHKQLQYLGEWLSVPNLWHLNRRSVAGAVSIGLFIAFLPLPGQMLVAAIAAVWTRVNLPVSVLMVWVTNPLTMGPIFFFAYKVGTWLLGISVQEVTFELTWHWLQTRLVTIWEPFLLGCLVVGLVVGLTGGMLTLGLWRMEVGRRWKERKRRKIIPKPGDKRCA
ncbi:conserved hypothetical protein [Nitrosococcus halophilus Nc 4]|uniref:DUF2062 domain-containing protein n=1 Tax=Nitrosococcus halophilus (strain Nc4) TaxID=472759 RepID=D5BW65_NITHN|nr:DUF2062 domain-containing protein [Nitrosococcus halophilus]ADE13715.1 conserved hypothetical protein [Nitrosococcus halophilus Nc 4]